MKRIYIQPSTTEQSIRHNSIICASGSTQSNVGIRGGDLGYNPNSAL